MRWNPIAAFAGHKLPQDSIQVSLAGGLIFWRNEATLAWSLIDSECQMWFNSFAFKFALRDIGTLRLRIFKAVGQFANIAEPDIAKNFLDARKW